jgi:predicted transcriptional regulator
MPRPKNPEGPREQRPGGKQATSYRLAPETRSRIEELATRLHIAQSAVVELAIRELAKREGLA